MNLLQNPRFDGPGGPPTTITGNGIDGISAADLWATRNNSEAATTTDLLPTTCPGGTGHMLHVCTTGLGNGITQTFGPPSPPLDRILASVKVFVVRGRVGMGTGNGHATNVTQFSTTTGEWETLHGPNGNSPATEFVVYSESLGGACYYIDDASVEPTSAVHLSIRGQASGEVLLGTPLVVAVEGQGFTPLHRASVKVFANLDRTGTALIMGSAEIDGSGHFDFAVRTNKVACNEELTAQATDDATSTVSSPDTFTVLCP